MAKRTLRDEQGNEYEVELPDDGGGTGESGGDAGDILDIPEEAVEWLLDQWNQSKAAQRSASGGSQSNPPTPRARSLRILAKQATQQTPPQASQSGKAANRKRTLRLA